MKTFKELRSEIKTKKAGLDHPVDNSPDRNEPLHGKDLNSIKVPLAVHDEFKGSKGKHSLKTKEGKYQISKEE